jgi:hypothetical protein
MENTGIKEEYKLSEIDYDLLMDLRVDYAFKLLFTKGDPRLLVSLLTNGRFLAIRPAFDDFLRRSIFAS